MKIFCETVFSDTLPALRAILANELINTYSLNQLEVARRLGITQPAVSQYKSGLRGKHIELMLSNKKLMKWAKNLAGEIATGNIRFYEKVCQICGKIREEKMYSDKELQPFLCLLKMRKHKG